MFGIIPFFAWNKTSGVTCLGDLISTTSLKAYYKLNNTITDSSGNGYNITTNTGVTFDQGEARNVNFDYTGVFLLGSTNPSSSNKNLLYSSSTGFPDTASSTGLASYTGWFKWDNIPVTTESYLFTYGKTGQKTITLDYEPSAGVYRLQTYNGASGVNGTYSATPNTGQWYHISLTQNGSSFKFYIDGTNVTTWTITNDGNAGNNRFVLGGLNTVARTFLGWIDDFSVWTRVLTDGEITTLANSTCPLSS